MVTASILTLPPELLANITERCSYCLKVRSASRFSNAMMKGRRGKHSSVSWGRDERLDRFCIDCGVAFGRYIPGTKFEFGGSCATGDSGGGRGIVCYGCRKFKR